MRAYHSSDDLAVWTAPDSLATNLAELDDWLVHQYGFNLHEFLAGRRACEGRRGAPLPDSQSVHLRPGTVVHDAAPATPSDPLAPYLGGQAAAPAPIPSDSLPHTLGAVGGGHSAPVLRGAWLSRQPRPLRAVSLIAGVLLAILLALRGRA